MGRWTKTKEAVLSITKAEVLSGQPDEKREAVATIEKPKQESKCDLLAERVQILTEDIAEMHQDFGELVALMGNCFGEPLKTKAANIALKHKR